MNFCKICVTPNTRPRVVFDKTGICNACINAEKKSKLINGIVTGNIKFNSFSGNITPPKFVTPFDFSN